MTDESMELARRIAKTIAKAKATHEDKFMALMAAIVALGVPR